MLCKCIKYVFTGFITIFMLTSMIAHLARVENGYTVEKYEPTKICYSFLIDNLQQKYLLGENLNFTKPCYETNLIPKVTYHISNFINCLEGKYVGQPLTMFPPIAMCREKFVKNSLLAIVNDFKDMMEEQTPTIEALWERFCLDPNIIRKLDSIATNYDCL